MEFFPKWFKQETRLAEPAQQCDDELVGQV